MYDTSDHCLVSSQPILAHFLETVFEEVLLKYVDRNQKQDVEETSCCFAQIRIMPYHTATAVEYSYFILRQYVHGYVMYFVDSSSSKIVIFIGLIPPFMWLIYRSLEQTLVRIPFFSCLLLFFMLYQYGQCCFLSYFEGCRWHKIELQVLH